MTLDIGEAVRDGVDRATERNGLALMGAFILLGVASAVVTQTLTAELVAEFPQQQERPALSPENLGPTPLALPLPFGAALAAAFALALVAEALYIVAVRTFVSDERSTVPGEFVRRRIAWVTINGFLGGVVVLTLLILPLVVAFLLAGGVQLAVGRVAGLVALLGGLLVGGVIAAFLYIAFFFVRQEIAVEDKNFIDALADSWTLTGDSRIELFVLALVILVVELLARFPYLGLDVVEQPTSLLVGTLVLLGTVISAVVGVFVIAVVSRAYVQLREAEPLPEPEEETEPDEDEYTGALGPEDLDPPE